MLDDARPARRTVLGSVLGGAAALGASAGLAGCGANGPAGRDAVGRVTTWDLFSGADGINMRGMISAVEQDVDGLTVAPTTLAWGSPYYTKLAMASASRQPPDTAISHVSRMPGFAPGGLLQPWTQEGLQSVGLVKEDFSEALWESCTYEGELFALPLDTHPFLLMVNPDIADRAGVAEPDGSLAIESPEQFFEIGTRLAEASGDHGVSFGYVLDTAQAWRLFWGLFHQAGGTYELEPGRPAVLDEDAAVRVIEAVTGWMDGTCMADNQDYTGALSAFNGGRSGAILSGVWELVGFQETVPSVTGQKMPTMFGTPATYADSHAYVLPSRRDPDPEKLAYVHEFVAGIIRQGNQWATAGHIPAYLPLHETEEYQQLGPQAAYGDAIDEVVLDPPTWFAGGGTDFQNQMCQPLIRAFQGTIAPGEAATDLVAVLDGFLSAPDPTA
jgi:multiple sugar transport system substrate-binding protein